MPLLPPVCDDARYISLSRFWHKTKQNTASSKTTKKRENALSKEIIVRFENETNRDEKKQKKQPQKPKGRFPDERRVPTQQKNLTKKKKDTRLLFSTEI